MPKSLFRLCSSLSVLQPQPPPLHYPHPIPQVNDNTEKESE